MTHAQQVGLAILALPAFIMWSHVPELRWMSLGAGLAWLFAPFFILGAGLLMFGGRP